MKKMRSLITGKPVSVLKLELKTEFKPELYDNWFYPRYNARYGVYDYLGHIPPEIVENVLYYYTKEGGLIVDPMAGGGIVYRVCQEWNRRCLVYDIQPKHDYIKKNDIEDGYPEEARNCDLIFLDPPYYDMKDYGIRWDSPYRFYKFIENLAKDSFNTVKDSGYVAFLMMSKTFPENECLTLKCAKIFMDSGFEPFADIAAPLSSEQFKPHYVIRAKREKKILYLKRALYIFQKPK